MVEAEGVRQRAREGLGWWGRQPRFGQRLAIDGDPALDRGDGVAGQTDHPFDQIGIVRLLQRRSLEHHDVPPGHRVQVVAELVHDDAVTHLERGQHRSRGDVEHLGHVHPDADGQHQGDAQDHQPFEGPPPPTGAAPAWRPRRDQPWRPLLQRQFGDQGRGGNRGEASTGRQFGDRRGSPARRCRTAHRGPRTRGLHRSLVREGVHGGLRLVQPGVGSMPPLCDV